MLKFALPYPPSVNNSYLTTKRGKRVKLAKARHYVRDAVYWIKQQKLQPFGDVPVSLKIGYHPPDKRRRDADNILKATLDVLETAGLIDNDFQVVHLEVTRLEPIQFGRLELEMESASALWVQG